MNETILFYGTMAEGTVIVHHIPLPKGAEPLVTSGQELDPLDPIATIQTHGRHAIIDTARSLGLPLRKLRNVLFVNSGDEIEKGEILAQHKNWLRKKKEVAAPFNGKILDIDEGVLFLEEDKEYEDIITPIPGKVAEVELDDHISIWAYGIRLDLAWGINGSAWAPLKAVKKWQTETYPDEITFEMRGDILLIPSQLTEHLLKRAQETGVKGVIGGSAQASLIPSMKEAGFPIGLVNGFGRHPMCHEIYELLSFHDGNNLALDTMPSDNWRGSRPQIIIPLKHDKEILQQPPVRISEYEPGCTVRITQSPYHGVIGTIASLTPQMTRLESGFWRKGAYVRFDESEIFVPFENLEHIK